MGSGFHLWWKGVPSNEPIVACSVVLEVVQPPTVAALYFWALQASFLDAHRPVLRRGPHRAPVEPPPPGQPGGELGWLRAGGRRHLHPGRQRLTAARHPRGPEHPHVRVARRDPVPLHDPSRHRRVGVDGDRSGRPAPEVTVRELYAAGDRLGGFVMWSELFCRGDDPPTRCGGRSRRPSPRPVADRAAAALHATFPDGPEWRDLDVVVDGVGVQQVTTTGRTLRGGVVPAAPRRPLTHPIRPPASGSSSSRGRSGRAGRRR